MNKVSVRLVAVIVLIVLTSGCIGSSTDETKTFSDGVMSFNYPGFFNNSELNNDTPNYQIIASFTTESVFNLQAIDTFKNKTEVTPTEARDNSISKVKNDSSNQVVSVTTETNPNGVVVERYTYIGNRESHTEMVNLMFFKIGNSVYGIAVLGSDSFKQQITDTTNIVFQSIK